MTQQRLQKILAQAGLGSRRKCEALIRDGRVTVNGETAELGRKVDPETAVIRIDGELLPAFERTRTILLYKPVGVLSSTRSQGGKPTVLDLLPTPERLYPAGRLDLDSEGLIILTNDGDLAYKLTHPRQGLEKEYRVLFDRRPKPPDLVAWSRGVVLSGGIKTLPAEVWIERETKDGVWVRFVLHQGRKRQLRLMARSSGLNVKRLVRIRIGRLSLGDLRPGEWRQLNRGEIQHLLAGSDGDRGPRPRRGGKGGSRGASSKGRVEKAR